tara:strand:+ start:314 stop:661 length:348 start_codon:yes stop_codon:yes gene_type:complete
MADQIPTSNAYSEYFNTNQCRSFAQTIVTTAVTQLTAQPCSEVILVNRTGATLSAFDQNYIFTNNKTVSAFAMTVKTDESFTFRGLTNSDQLSVIGSSAGMINFRTQFFSSNPSR